MGAPLSSADVDRAALRVQDASRARPAPPSYFEATTALALEAFREARVDIAVLEVGLGGRLDATNVVSPVAVAITAIDFDHQEYLGHTIEAIAGEKAGVIKPGIPVVLAGNRPEADLVIAARCRDVGATLIRAGVGVEAHSSMAAVRTELTLRTPVAAYGPLTLGLNGRHQVDNAITAVRLLEVLDGLELSVGLSGAGRLRIGPEAIATALTDVTWPARLEWLRYEGTDVLLDGAHNPAGAWALASYLHDAVGRRVPMVIGAMRDKDIGAMLAAWADCASHFVFTAPDSPRASPPDALVAQAAIAALRVPAVAVMPAIDAVRHATSLGTPVVVAGSLYLAGEVRARIV
jgi:dihydrofolate synthase/folylpolyglutamate synthase